MKGRKKLTGDPQLSGLCIALILVLAAALILSQVKLSGLRSQNSRLVEKNQILEAENGSLAAENESMASALAENRDSTAGGSGDEAGSLASGTGGPGDEAGSLAPGTGGPGDEAGSLASGTGGPDSGEDESSAGESTAAPEPEKLETLDGVTAGTVVTRADLDTEHMEKYFQAYEIKTTGAVYSRINGKSYRENPDVALGDLRYLKVLHYNFSHEQQVGEMIVNKGLADEVLEIFRELYESEYEIQSMRLVDNYWAGNGEDSDTASIDKNNSSAFNYRPVTGGGKLSNHAYGFAIDINPQQNPYVSYRDGKARWEHENADRYIERDTGLAHVITHDDLAFKLFKEHGFTWGGDWNNPKDYQHFEKKLY